MDLSSQWPDESAAFFAFWKDLRQTALVPRSEDLLDRLPVHFAPCCYLADLTEEGAVVRYQGLQLLGLWGGELTGRDLLEDRRAKYKERSLNNMRLAMRQPCGQYATFFIHTSLGETICPAYLSLPLAVSAGRPARIVGFVHSVSSHDRPDWEPQTMETGQMDWVDIGGGVPSSPPEKPDPP